MSETPFPKDPLAFVDRVAENIADGGEIYFNQNDLWRFLNEEGVLLPVTEYTRLLGVGMECGISLTLYDILRPYAEDEVKGIQFNHRLDDLVSEYKKWSGFAMKSSFKFELKFSSYIKGVKKLMGKNGSVDIQVTPFADGLARTRTVEVTCGTIHDGVGGQALIFFRADDLPGVL